MISYLERLKFDPSLTQTLHFKYLTNIRLVILIVLTILAVGVGSFLTLPRRLNPEIKLTIVTISTVLPGAGPKDIESLITQPFETKLLGIKGLDLVTSSSQNNISIITLQFLSSVEKERARNDVQTAISEIDNLPPDAQAPKVNALDFEDSPIWTFSLYAKDNKNDLPGLMRYSRLLKEKLETLPSVDRVVLTGSDEQEIQVIFDQNKIQKYQVNPFLISQSLKNATMSFPSGNIESGRANFSLSLDAQTNSIEDIRNIKINSAGNSFRLGDLATVARISKNNQQKTFLMLENKPIKNSVVFSVYKTSASDIDKTISRVEKLVEETIGRNGNYQIFSVLNSGELITKQFQDLVGEFKSTLILVFINLFLFLGIRQAAIAITTIPLTFLMSFAWMSIFGQSLNFISLFALLLAFGTSIDDTIVTVSAMTAYFKTKKFTPVQAGLLIWRDFVIPIWATTITTVWAFLPLILTSGIIGEFIKPIPLVVATTMYTSTAVTWFITLPFLIILFKLKIPQRIKILTGVSLFFVVLFVLITILPKNIFLIFTVLLYTVFSVFILKNKIIFVDLFESFIKKQKKLRRICELAKLIFTKGVINTEFLSSRYQKIIVLILNSKRGRKTVLFCLLVFTITSYLLLPLGLVKNEFFPKANEDAIYLGLELPSGTSVGFLEKETKSVLNQMKDIPQTMAIVAQTQSGTGEGFQQSVSSQNSSLFTVVLQPKEKRNLSSMEIAKILREKFANYETGRITVSEISGGPPAGSDVQIKISGDDLFVLNLTANKIMDFLKSQPGIINIDKSVKSGTGKIVFVPDDTKMAEYKISLDTIGFWLRTQVSGFHLDKVKFDGNEEDVVFLTQKGSLNPESLNSITIPTQIEDVPLSSIGSFRLSENPTVIIHENGKRTISVSASVQSGHSVSEANKHLLAFAKNKLQLPEGYEYKTGGVNEENQKSVNSILRAMGLSFILIMATMVVEFNSFRQAAMILSLIPFAVSGVFVIFALSQTPVSFPSLIGIMALFGVVVTNAMFIVEKINQNRSKKMRLIEAISDAAKGRLEPILLTSLTSILGLIPITLANPLWRGLGGAIVSGLMFSGMIMLLYIPVMYYTIYQKEDVQNSIRP